jgi:hypothetical protein
MLKKTIAVVFMLSLAGSAWAKPYIGEVPYNWSTNSAVTVTASSAGDVNFAASYTINGGAFEATGDPKGSKGVLHTYNPIRNAWISGGQSWGSGAGNPVGLAAASSTEPNGVLQWIRWKFDKTYTIHDVMIWNGYTQGPQASWSCKNVRIDYSTDGIHWTRLGDANYVFTPTDSSDNYAWFGPNNNIRMDVDANNVVFSIYSNYYYPIATADPAYDKSIPLAATMVISEVRFYPPYALASDPNITDGMKNVPLRPNFTWTAGDSAASASGHRVYFGTNFNDVNNATTGYVVKSDPNYAPAANLSLGQNYYWRVDEVNGVNVWKGKVWGFTTVNNSVVENFNKYATQSSLRNVWVPLPASPTSVYLETILAKSSDNSRSMRLEPQNAASPYYLQATRTFATNQNWTADNIKSLSIYFCGDPCNVKQPLYLKLTDSASVTKKLVHPDPNAIRVNRWREWRIDLADPNFSGLNKAQITSITIGVGGTGSSSGQPAGDKDILWIDNIVLYTTRCITALTGYDGDINQDCVVDYKDLDLLVTDWLDAQSTITTVNPGSTGLIAHWAFDEGTGSTVAESVNSYDGSMYSESGLWAWTTGKVGAYALDFKKEGMCKIVNGSPVIASLDKQATLAMWVYGDPKLTETSGLLMNARDAGESCDIINWVLINGTTTFCSIGSASGYGPLSPDTVSYNWPDPNYIGRWTHLAVTKNADTGEMVMYQDGRVIATSSGKTKPINGSTEYYFGIAGHPCYPSADQHYFNGATDEARIYNRVLSPAEIAYLAGFTTTLYQPLFGQAAATDAALVTDGKIDLKDFAVVALDWLKPQILFP